MNILLYLVIINVLTIVENTLFKLLHHKNVLIVVNFINIHNKILNIVVNNVHKIHINIYLIQMIKNVQVQSHVMKQNK